MTYQAPPPPGGNAPPPPPPPGGYGPPPGSSGGYGGRSSFDPKSVNPLDWGILACGLLAFIFSFVSYYTYSLGPFSGSVNAWHGFFGWFAMLLALAGSAIVAVHLFAPSVQLPFAARLIALGLYAVASLCVIIAIFVVPGNTGGFGVHINKGHGFGFWISLIVILAGTVLCLMRLQQTGGQLPGRLASMPNIGRHGPQGGISGGQQQGYGTQSQGYNAPPGYGAPPAPGAGAPPPQPGYGTPPSAPPPQQGYGQPPQ